MNATRRLGFHTRPAPAAARSFSRSLPTVAEAAAASRRRQSSSLLLLRFKTDYAAHSWNELR